MEDARLTGQYACSIGTSSPISPVNFIILTPMSRKPACSLVPSHNATVHRRHWLTRFRRQAQVELSIRASATLPAGALRASGQLWGFPRRGQEYRITLRTGTDSMPFE
jgi:hypothetical protein